MITIIYYFTNLILKPFFFAVLKGVCYFACVYPFGAFLSWSFFLFLSVIYVKEMHLRNYFSNLEISSNFRSFCLALWIQGWKVEIQINESLPYYTAAYLSTKCTTIIVLSW